MKPCSIIGCTRQATRRSWCNGHYQRWLRFATPENVSRIGRRPKLTYPQLRRIDNWYATRVRWKTPIKCIAATIGCSYGTVIDAAKRQGAYRDCPRG
jgi:hypothetical protein